MSEKLSHDDQASYKIVIAPWADNLPLPLNNGKDAYTATARITEGDGTTPVAGVLLTFELSDETVHAIFTDSRKAMTNGISNKNGEVTKYFTDTKKETGLLMVYLKGDDGTRYNMDCRPFQFWS